MGEGDTTQPIAHKKWHLQLNNLLSLFPDYRSLEALRLFHFELSLSIFVQAHNVSINTLLLKSLWASYEGSYNHTLKMIFTLSQFHTLRAFCL